jgi:sulfoxide reductase heme-binding subunit YedZ
VSRRTRAAIAAYGAATLAVLGILGWGLSTGWSVERELVLARGTGWCALVALLGSLSATPLGKLIGRLRGRSVEPATSAARRAIGIASAGLALLHASLSFATYLRGALAPVVELSWLRGGLLALSILSALLVTSFPIVVARARVTLWKPLHRLAYVAALFALQHVALSPLADRRWVLGVFGAALAVSLLRWVPAPAGAQRRPDQPSTTPSHSESQEEI